MIITKCLGNLVFVLTPIQTDCTLTMISLIMVVSGHKPLDSTFLLLPLSTFPLIIIFFSFSQYKNISKYPLNFDGHFLQVILTTFKF